MHAAKKQKSRANSVYGIEILNAKKGIHSGSIIAMNGNESKLHGVLDA